MRPVVVITGPTAVGKSAVADALALQWETEVLSADAMQVYKRMDIGTAKTPVADRPVPLRLVDIVDPGEPYSAALFQRDARAVIADIRSRGKDVIMCGGTGLYIRAALDDMRFPHGEIMDERRRAYQDLAGRLGAEGMHDLLKACDPRSAEVIHPNNLVRVIRALEMADDGVSYADQKAGFSTPQPWCEHLVFALSMDRDRLYRRIDERVDLMIEQGLVEEVSGLVRDGLSEALTAQQAIGYKEIIQYLEGELTLTEAVDLIKSRSRRYAKRQLSWCRRDSRTTWIDMDALGVEGAVREIIRLVG